MRRDQVVQDINRINSDLFWSAYLMRRGNIEGGYAYSEKNLAAGRLELLKERAFLTGMLVRRPKVK